MSVTQYVRERRDAFVETLKELVAFETPTTDAALCARMADDLQRRCQALGFHVGRLVPEGRGPHLIATRTGGSGPRTLVLMHYDTVWPEGTLARRPVRIDGDRFDGPGSLDMKGGIAVFLLACEALVQTGTPFAGPVTALLTSDEELSSSTSRALIEEQARNHDRTFVLEPGQGAFNLRMARKGVGRYQVRFHGVPSHAGNAPEAGASAVVEMAHFVLYSRELEDLDEGTSVTAGVARGGTTANVVPEEAYLDYDVRVWTAARGAELDVALRAYAPRDPRVEVRIEGGLTRPPMEFTDANRDLFDVARDKAARLGRELGWARVGGGSDGSFASDVGCATLDGLGACGEGPHTTGEHIRIGDSLERAALFALLLADA